MGIFKSRLFWIALVVIAVASTLPLYVSGYVLGVLTVATTSACSRWPGTCCSASPARSISAQPS